MGTFLGGVCAGLTQVLRNNVPGGSGTVSIAARYVGANVRLPLSLAGRPRCFFSSTCLNLNTPQLRRAATPRSFATSSALRILKTGGIPLRRFLCCGIAGLQESLVTAGESAIRNAFRSREVNSVSPIHGGIAQTKAFSSRSILFVTTLEMLLRSLDVPKEYAVVNVVPVGKHGHAVLLVAQPPSSSRRWPILRPIGSPGDTRRVSHCQ